MAIRGSQQVAAPAPGLTVVATASALALGSWVALRGNHIDYDVYIRAGQRVLGSQALYDTHGELPFTYPPFAALLAVVFAQAPVLGLVALSLLTMGAAVWSTARVLSEAGWRPEPVALVVALAVASEPVLRGLQLGQVNGLVIGLVLADVLLLPPQWRGVLVGLAAGIKLTPLVLLLHFGVRREWAAAARCLAAFGATAVVGLLVLPSDSVRFWSGVFADPHRVGDPGFVDNQSLRGLVERLDLPSPTLLWLGASVVALVAGGAVIRWVRGADPVQSVLVCLLVGLLVSPISWSHHWIVLPALSALLVVRARAARNGIGQVAGWVALAAAVAAPHWRVAVGMAGPRPSSALDQLVASSMVGVGLMILAALHVGSMVRIPAERAIDRLAP